MNDLEQLTREAITNSICEKICAVSATLMDNADLAAARSEQISGMIELAQLVSMPASLLEKLEEHRATLDTTASDARPWNRRSS